MGDLFIAQFFLKPLAVCRETKDYSAETWTDLCAHVLIFQQFMRFAATATAPQQKQLSALSL